MTSREIIEIQNLVSGSFQKSDTLVATATFVFANNLAEAAYAQALGTGAVRNKERTKTCQSSPYSFSVLLVEKKRFTQYWYMAVTWIWNFVFTCTKMGNFKNPIQTGILIVAKVKVNKLCHYQKFCTPNDSCYVFVCFFQLHASRNPVFNCCKDH